MNGVPGVSPASSQIIRAVRCSAGLTPEMRLAWPRSAGRTAESFSRASSRSPWME